MSASMLLSFAPPGPAPPVDLVAEGLLSLTEVAGIIPLPGGRSVSVPAVLRWIIKGRSGVCLEAVRRNGAWFTSLPALARFAVALKQCPRS